MKLGVKEFRERFGEIAVGGRQVLVTKSGRIVGRYEPMPDGEASPVAALDWDAIERRLEAFRTDFRATTPDWREQLAAIGLDADGEPIDPCD